jgi:hypothetical protein
MTTATANPAAAARPFTARLLDVVRGFAGHDLDARSLHGFEHVTGRLPDPVPALPGFLLGWLEDGHHVRVSPSPASGGLLHVAWVYWRLGDQFDRETGWRHRVPESDQARVRDALAGCPIAPAWLIDAGPEVVVGWPLAAPLPTDRAPAVLERLARRLGAAWPLPATLPLAGVIRNWNQRAPERVELVDVAPAATYTLEALERAIAAPTTKGGRT